MTTVLLAAEDLAIDRELADIASSFRFLLDLTPVDLTAARTSFLAGEDTNPTFTYPSLEDDPAVIATRLASVSTDGVQDGIVAHLLEAKRRELELQLEMLQCRGSSEFLARSIELYGTASHALVAEAENLLAEVETAAPEPSARLDASSFAALAEAEVARYRRADPDVACHVEVRDDVSGVVVQHSQLLIPSALQLPEARAHALIQHEVGTHVLTHVNGARQPLRTLSVGLAGYEETQEGLAVLAEYLVGGLTGRRLRQLAARVVAVDRLVSGESFATVHHELVGTGIAPVEAFTVTARVFRAGGLTKDAVYLKGLQDLVAHLQGGHDLDLLWLGKMPLVAVPLLAELLDRGVLYEPWLLPRFLDEDPTQARLTDLRGFTSLTDLLEEAA